MYVTKTEEMLSNVFWGGLVKRNLPLVDKIDTDHCSCYNMNRLVAGQAMVTAYNLYRSFDRRGREHPLCGYCDADVATFLYVLKEKHIVGIIPEINCIRFILNKFILRVKAYRETDINSGIVNIHLSH